MPLPPYHISEQNAHALLNPVRLALGDLESRLQHYLDRIPMGEADRDRVGQAREAVERARQAVEQLSGNH